MNMISRIHEQQAEAELAAAAETALADAPAPAKRPRWRRLALLAAPLVLAGSAYGLLHKPDPAIAALPPPTVTVSAPLQRAVTEWDDYVGRFEPSRSVEVRPRVSGAIVAIHFKDGEVVRAGQPLFTIDPRP